MNLNVLFVEDDPKLRSDLIKLFDNSDLGGHHIKAHEAESFEKGIELIKRHDYDLAILDLYRGDPKEGNDKMGLEVLKEIQSNTFTPVIFYSGLTKYLEGFESQIIGVVNKGDGIEKLESEILRILNSNIGLIKGKVHEHIRTALRDYFWEIVDKHKVIFEPVKNDISLGYLLLRRLSNSLSKENIKVLLGDDKIDPHKAHPMEFYIFPSNSKEYEVAEILFKDGDFYVNLTPSCDFVLRTKKDGSVERKVGYVLLARVVPLSDFQQFKDYSSSQSKDNKNKLAALITNNVSDRYFFLPGTPFIKASVIDFQNKIMVEYENLKEFDRVTKLDNPFAQSMIASFIRYYNRIGFPDIDPDYIIRNL